MGSSSSKKKQNVSFDISIGNDLIGRVEFQLFDRVVSKTA